MHKVNSTWQIGYRKIVGVFFDGMLTAGAIWGVNSIIEFFEESRIK
jgi:hypothetical protein